MNSATPEGGRLDEIIRPLAVCLVAGLLATVSRAAIPRTGTVGVTTVGSLPVLRTTIEPFGMKEVRP